MPDIINMVLYNIDSASSISLVYKKALKKYPKELDKKQKAKIYRYLLSRVFYDEISLIIKDI